jgi:hypothetical protein
VPTPSVQWTNKPETDRPLKLTDPYTPIRPFSNHALDGLENLSILSICSGTLNKALNVNFSQTLTPSAEIERSWTRRIRYCQEGPGWKPPKEMLAAAIKGRQPKPSNPYFAQWQAVPMSVGGDGPPGTVSATVDISLLEGRYPHAVRLAWPLAGTQTSKGDDMCCVSQVRRFMLPLLL